VRSAKTYSLFPSVLDKRTGVAYRVGFGRCRTDSAALAVRADDQPEPGLAVLPHFEGDFQMTANWCRYHRILTDCALRLVAIRVGWLADQVAGRFEHKAASLLCNRSSVSRLRFAESTTASISFAQNALPLLASPSPNIATASKMGEGFIEENTAFQVRDFISIAVTFRQISAY